MKPSELPKKPTAKKHIRMFCKPRTGHKTVLAWMSYLTTGKAYCLTYCRHFNDPWLKFTRPSPSEAFLGPWRKTDYREFLAMQKECVISSYDATPLSELTLTGLQHNARLLGGAESVKDVIHIRDPYNHFASLIMKSLRHSDWKVQDWPAEVARWREHACEAVGRSSFIPNKIVSNFNLFMRSKTYRVHLAAQLDLNWDDKLDRKGANTVAASGKGSSFDGMRWEGDNLEAPLRSRWRQIPKEWAFYRSLVNSLWMAELAEQLFHDDSEVMAAIKALCTEKRW